MHRLLRTSYKVATIWGIPIRIHISLIVFMIYFLVHVLVSGYGPTGVLLVLVVSACAFTSIALHELGHSFVAIHKGAGVRDITLMFMGGVASMESIPRRPMDELLMALAGPAVSLVLGLAGVGLSWRLRVFGLNAFADVVYWMGMWNLFLVAFNLLPAFPMDGGRVLRALLTRKQGRLRATYIASRIGRVLAIGFGVVGFVGIPGVFPNGNLVLTVIAIFIYFAAGREYQMVQYEEAARRGGVWPWDPDPIPGPPGSAEDVVVVGPSPYATGRESHETRTSVRREQ